MKQLLNLVYPYRHSSLWRALNKRNFICYGVGLEKSGTHSLAAMLENQYRSQHEADVDLLNNSWLDYNDNTITKKQFHSRLKRRDTYGWLEMDASHPHVHYIKDFLELHPNAKFVLTIRDCYSWLTSVINQHINIERKAYFNRLNEHRYSNSPLTHDDHDSFLKTDYNLPSASCYLAYWNEHIKKVLQECPKEQLLIIRTHELKHSQSQLAQFLGIPESTINTTKSHSYRANRKIPILKMIGKEHAKELASKHCGEHMGLYFPEDHYLDKALSQEDPE